MSRPIRVATWRRIAIASAWGVGLTIAFHWGFNAALPELLQVPETSFKQSLGLVLMAAALGAVFTAPIAGQRRYHRKSHG